LHPAATALRLAVALFMMGERGQRREFPINSTCVQSVVFDDGDTFVRLNTGHEYQITSQQAEGLLAAQSPGSYFNEHIRLKA